MLTYLMIAAAAALVLWPTSTAPKAPSISPLGPAIEVPPLTPSYASAIESLSQVRRRLSYTEKLSEKESDAITALTLALVAGSDKR